MKILDQAAHSSHSLFGCSFAPEGYTFVGNGTPAIIDN